MGINRELNGEGFPPEAEEFVPFVIDDFELLKLAHPVNLKAEVRLGSGEVVPVLMSGEATVYGEMVDGRFRLDRLDRLAFGGRRAEGVDPELAAALRLMSLSAWLPEGGVGIAGEMAGEDENEERRWVFGDVFFRLHYARLSDLDEYVFEDHVFVPPVEFLVGEVVVWENRRFQEEGRIFLDLAITLPELAEGSGFVVGVDLPRVTLDFFGRGNWPLPVEPANSLISCQQPADAPCDDPLFQTYQWEVPLQFINLTQTLDQTSLARLNELEAICQAQIDAACVVWGQKGALEVKVAPDVMEGTPEQKETYAQCTTQKAGRLGKTQLVNESQLQVFIVDGLFDPGGGVCANPGLPAAYIILTKDQLGENLQLLAHELCHAIGLDHPGRPATNVSIPGDFGSIAQAGTPNSVINSLVNCQVFSNRVLNKLVMHRVDLSGGWIEDCFQPG